MKRRGYRIHHVAKVSIQTPNCCALLSCTSSCCLFAQVHYLSGRPKDDTSGVRLALTADHMPFSAGMLMYASAFSIPPGRQSTLVPNRCCLRGFEPAHGFAFRVHTHALGEHLPSVTMHPHP